MQKVKAGRPPKNRERKGKINGILKNPPEHLVFQFTYCYRDTFKNLLDYFKKVNTKDFIIYMKPDECIFLTEKSDGNCFVMIEFVCDRLNNYYCDPENKPFFRLELDKIRTLLRNKDETKTFITFQITKTERFKMEIIIHNESNKSENKIIVSLDYKELETYEKKIIKFKTKFAERELYPLNFMMPWTEFKDIVVPWSKSFKDENIRLEIGKNLPLSFNTNSNNDDKGNNTLDDPKYRIEFYPEKTECPELLSISININLLVLAGYYDKLSKIIKIYVDESRKLIITANVDEILENKISLPNTEIANIKYFFNI